MRQFLDFPHARHDPVALDPIPQCDSTSDSRFSSISCLSGSDGARVVRSVMASDLLNHSRNSSYHTKDHALPAARTHEIVVLLRLWLYNHVSPWRSSEVMMIFRLSGLVPYIV